MSFFANCQRPARCVSCTNWPCSAHQSALVICRNSSGASEGVSSPSLCIMFHWHWRKTGIPSCSSSAVTFRCCRPFRYLLVGKYACQGTADFSKSVSGQVVQVTRPAFEDILFRKLQAGSAWDRISQVKHVASVGTFAGHGRYA